MASPKCFFQILGFSEPQPQSAVRRVIYRWPVSSRGGSREEFLFLFLGGGHPMLSFFHLFAFATVKYCWTINIFVEREGVERNVIYRTHTYLSNPLGGQILLLWVSLGGS